ncbi:MAG TPA: response regulator [Bacteroidales bacterium]|nr:response regulator [Bacteroidales bacterium]
MNQTDNILIIDDEIQIRRLLEITLGANGYRTVLAANGKEGIALAALNHPILVILDLGLPDMDGIEVLKNLREWYTRPILILTVKNSEDYIVGALDSGANDYLTKPFRSGELLARIRTAFRLTIEKNEQQVLNFGNLSIDLVNHIVKKNDSLVKLTATEFHLLAFLAKNQGRVITHQSLLKEVWGFRYLEQTQYLRVFVAQLRKKIEDNPSKPNLLITESGIGYRFGE